MVKNQWVLYQTSIIYASFSETIAVKWYKVSNLPTLNELWSKIKDIGYIPQVRAFGLPFITSPCPEAATRILALTVVGKWSLTSPLSPQWFSKLSSQIHYCTFSPRLPDGPASPGKPADPCIKRKQICTCMMSIQGHGQQLSRNRAESISSSQRRNPICVQVHLWASEGCTSYPAPSPGRRTQHLSTPTANSCCQKGNCSHVITILPHQPRSATELNLALLRALQTYK